MTAQRQAVLAGHHDVQNHQVDGAGVQHLTRRLGAVGRGHPIPVLFQIARQGIPDIRVVVDDQDVFAVRHVKQVSECHYAKGPGGGGQKFVTNCVIPAARHVLRQ